MDHRSFEFLYCFKSHGVCLLEMKRTDLPDGAPPDQCFFWLRINLESSQVERLTFQDAGREENLEVREFDDCSLTFDEEMAEYVPEEGLALALDRIAKKSIPKSIKALSVDYVIKLITDGAGDES